MRQCYFDCFSGISGDMTVGALIDAGAEFDVLRAGLDSLGLEGFCVSAEAVKKKGMAASQFHVHVDPDAPQPHRHLHHIEAIIQDGDLPDAVKQHAKDTFRILGAAEAAVHGTSIEKVHFHEVGAIDSIVDIVAANYALHLLGIESVACSALAVGSGTVECAHGIMPVPAPATAKLLEGKPTYGGSAEGELVTPTGAALMVHRATAFGPMPPMTVTATGYGAGTRDLPRQPNLLRVLIGAVQEARREERIHVVETNIDDMNPELLPVLIEALLAASARDAFITPVIGKKGRAAHQVTALCTEDALDAVIAAFFTHSTTLGLRMRQEDRIVSERTWKKAATPWGAVRVKLGLRAGTQHAAAPEFEDCRLVADQANVPVRTVYEAALAAALKGDLEDA